MVGIDPDNDDEPMLHGRLDVSEDACPHCAIMEFAELMVTAGHEPLEVAEALFQASADFLAGFEVPDARAIVLEDMIRALPDAVEHFVKQRAIADQIKAKLKDALHVHGVAGCPSRTKH